MTVKVSSIGLKGLEGYRVQVEVRISPGTESIIIVGLPDASVKESRERVIVRHGDGSIVRLIFIISVNVYINPGALSPPEFCRSLVGF